MGPLPTIRRWLQTWPAAELTETDGWLLQATDGFTKRANAALRLSPGGSIATVEDFHRSRGLRPSVVDYASMADPLPELLITEGWQALPFDPVFAMPAEQLTAPDSDVPSEPMVSTAPTERWFTGWYAGGRSDCAAARALVVGSPQQGFALIDDSGTPSPIAVGRVAVVGEWAGINCLRTRPDQRGRGHGRSILGSLARFARDNGASRLQLSVEHDNPVAQRLYRRAGFEVVDHYRYLFAPE